MIVVTVNGELSFARAITVIAREAFPSTLSVLPELYDIVQKKIEFA